MVAHGTSHAPEIRQSQASWDAYLELRAAEENRHVRITFDRGNLELMSPSKSHERIGYLIGRCIDVWTTEWQIDVQACRTTTFRRKDLKRGLDPDNCYYIAHEHLVRSRDEVDLTIDPPPDLAIEVDVESSSLDRMAIYAALGVPEIWRWGSENLSVYRLDESGHYQSAVGSAALPGFPVDRVRDLLQRRGAANDTVLIRGFQQWVRERISRP